MKRLSVAIILLALMATTFSSCKKYDDGPSMSLLSAKSRLAREWKILKVVEVVTVNEIDVTTFWEGMELDIQKSGDFIRTKGNVSSAGTWEFSEDKEELRLKLSSSTDVEVYTIRRLTKDDLWLDRTVSTTITKFKFEAK
jgi:hypothetical protein